MLIFLKCASGERHEYFVAPHLLKKFKMISFIGNLLAITAEGYRQRFILEQTVIEVDSSGRVINVA